MGLFPRYNQAQLEKDLRKKLVFLAGPRQVGKTTLARAIAPAAHQYLNYDAVRDRKVITRQEWSGDTRLVVLDELHKMRGWKRWLKGIWDTNEGRHAFLVTGSARLDFVRRSGESLAGRYYLHRLHPLTVGELHGAMAPEMALTRLLAVSGFPEPFFAEEPVDVERWRRGHVDRIVREDLVDLQRVTQLQSIELLVELLSERVGSTISYASLAEDLRVAPKTVKHWLAILESLYVIFIVRPFARRLSRAIRKEPKVYFFDYGRVPDPGARLENLVACHLLKYNHAREDQLGKRTALHFVRDKEKREVDFLTLVDGAVELLVEVKSSEAELSRALRYYHERLRPQQAIQVVRHLDRDRSASGCAIKQLSPWLATLA